MGRRRIAERDRVRLVHRRATPLAARSEPDTTPFAREIEGPATLDMSAPRAPGSVAGHRIGLRLRAVELTGAGAGQERIPFGRGEDDCRAGWVLRVADANHSPGQVGDFYAIVPRAAVAGLEPSCIRQVRIHALHSLLAVLSSRFESAGLNATPRSWPKALRYRSINPLRS